MGLLDFVPDTLLRTSSASSTRSIKFFCSPGCGALHCGRCEAQARRTRVHWWHLISVKGEDIMLTTPSSHLVRFHRLRTSIPARLWKWKVVSGWKWKGDPEHINSLELRAVLTTLTWRVQHKRMVGSRFLHLIDSLVVLHALARGRSSSRKLRSTLSRINALLLCSSNQALWGYVRTDLNPADRPSRWGSRVRTKFRHA